MSREQRKDRKKYVGKREWLNKGRNDDEARLNDKSWRTRNGKERQEGKKERKKEGKKEIKKERKNERKNESKKKKERQKSWILRIESPQILQ